MCHCANLSDEGSALLWFAFFVAFLSESPLVTPTVHKYQNLCIVIKYWQSTSIKIFAWLSNISVFFWFGVFSIVLLHKTDTLWNLIVSVLLWYHLWLKKWYWIIYVLRNDIKMFHTSMKVVRKRSCSLVKARAVVLIFDQIIYLPTT